MNFLKVLIELSEEAEDKKLRHFSIRCSSSPEVKAVLIHFECRRPGDQPSDIRWHKDYFLSVRELEYDRNADALILEEGHKFIDEVTNG